MKPFKFFQEYVDVNHLFQYEIDGIYREFYITKYTFLTLESNFKKLIIDLDMDYLEFIEMIDDIKYKKTNGYIFCFTNDGIISKINFVGILYSSKQVLNTNECKLEFYLDFYNVV